ncbi:MAG TPA: MaoC family dehydratase N-terminal domain-containing protein [Pilimelia sp.]|nr:MaoC family dehydratase N-terminal domain-containing protein [Pilimelia sp.]
MPLNPSFVGRTYPPSAPYRVCREKIREFAAAIGAADPAHHEPDAARALGYPDVVAPVTFPVVFTWPATRTLVDDPELGLDFSRVVHGDQRFDYRRPVVAGDELVCTNTIEQISSRAGNDMITVRTDVATTGDEPVVSAWAMLVVRGGE